MVSYIQLRKCKVGIFNYVERVEIGVLFLHGNDDGYLFN